MFLENTAELVMRLCWALRNLHSSHKSGFKIKLSVIKGYMVTLKIIQLILRSSVHHTQEQGSAAENAGLKATLLVLTSAFCSQRQPYIPLCNLGVPASVRSLSIFLCSSSKKMRFHVFLSLTETYLSSNTATETLHAQVQIGHHSFLEAWTPFMLFP